MYLHIYQVCGTHVKFVLKRQYKGQQHSPKKRQDAMYFLRKDIYSLTMTKDNTIELKKGISG